jgi:hypothetical protein
VWRNHCARRSNVFRLFQPLRYSVRIRQTTRRFIAPLHSDRPRQSACPHVNGNEREIEACRRAHAPNRTARFLQQES